MEVLTPTEQIAAEADAPQIDAPVEEKLLIREITLRNLLSFGPQVAPIPLRGLNVLIGPNGSGKSNLIEAIALLRAAPGDMEALMRRGGGRQEWVWKGNPDGKPHLGIETDMFGDHPIRHVMELSGHFAWLIDSELIEVEGGEESFYYRSQRFHAVIKGRGKAEVTMDFNDFSSQQSILAQIREPNLYPELKYLTLAYQNIRIYREWTFGYNAVFRTPQKADMRNVWLEEDFSNLGLFLNKLRRNPAAKRAILTALADLYEGFSDFDVSIEGGAVQVFFTEGDFTIPATRLSDGTLRYLCLLAILCDTNPPPLICIEEPELGLHPDIIHKLADLIVLASERTQLIVTTHSDILVDALTERPEALLVCEKHAGQTEIKRLDSAKLAVWLERYRLGDLWTRGQLGGVRW